MFSCCSAISTRTANFKLPVMSERFSTKSVYVNVMVFVSRLMTASAITSPASFVILNV